MRYRQNARQVPPVERTTLVTTADRVEAYRGKILIGYADRDDKLFKMDADGFAVEIGTINHRTEIIDKITRHGK